MTINIDMTIDEPSEIDMAVTKAADTASFSLGSEMIVVKNHAILENRDKANQHPISAITGLEEALDGIPTKTSDLTNDSDFITSEDIPEVPTKISELTNDSGYITSSAVPTKTSQLTNDSGYVKATDIPTVPTKTSQLTNDSGFITSSAIPTVPTKTSQLTNDSGYITSADIPSIPVKSVNGKTGAVVLGASDVGALPSTYTAPVTSVNGQTGAVTVTEGLTPLIGTTSTVTPSQIATALAEGRDICVTGTTNYLGIDTSIDFTAWESATLEAEGQQYTFVTSNAISTLGDGDTTFVLVGALQGDSYEPISQLKMALKTDLADYVPTTRTVNNKALSNNITLSASDVGALPSTTTYAESSTVGGSASNTEGIPYGEVDSTSTATVFTATVPGITELKDGTLVFLRNAVVTSASGFTININGLGAKPVYNSMATGATPSRDTTIFNVAYTMLFVYSTTIVSGGGWICYRGYDANTNTIGYQLRTNSMSLPVSGACYRYRICFTSADGSHFVPSNTSSSTNATASRTVNQSPIDPFGRIVYYNYTTAVSSGSRLGATYITDQIVCALGYSFNRTGAALTLTPWKPVYVMAEPQADGSAIINATTPYVQELPTTADGNIYIFLGVAYSATNIELQINHPVYYIDTNGRKRIWTGEDISVV